MSTSDDLEPSSYADLAALAKRITLVDTHRDAPPDDLWARIEATAFADLGEQTASASAAPAHAGDAAPGEPGRTARSGDELAVRREARGRRLPTGWRIGLVAAAMVLVAGVVGVLVRRDDGGSTTLGEIALQNASQNPALDPAGRASTGTAKLVALKDGEYALDLRVDSLPAPEGDAFFELWMIDTQVHDMVSLGLVQRSERIMLPPSVDPKRFPIVDISIEPADGKPTHSGKSVLRGQLPV